MKASCLKLYAELQNKYPGITIKAKPFDLSKKEQALAFGEWCLKNGSPDVLVNNAGSFAGSNVHNEEDGALEEMIETNLYSAYHLTRAIVPGHDRKKERPYIQYVVHSRIEGLPTMEVLTASANSRCGDFQ